MSLQPLAPGALRHSTWLHSLCAPQPVSSVPSARPPTLSQALPTMGPAAPPPNLDISRIQAPVKASTAPQYLRSGLKAADPKPATPAKPAKPEPTTFAITPLPYAYDALVKKGISKEQITVHYDKHHKGYASKLTDLVAKDPKLHGYALEELLMTQPPGPVFNCAAQIWNHNFYWHSMSPEGGGAPKGALLQAIEAQWGTFEKFKAEFSAAAGAHFGSGWAWLVKTPLKRLAIVTTKDADIPALRGLHPLLVCDVWEHAYYIDYRNDRAAHLKAFWDAVNWDFANFNWIMTGG